MNDEMGLSLTRDEGRWVDQDGCSWGSPAEWFFMGILGGCGCGRSREITELAVKTLRHFGTAHERRDLKVYEDLAMEVLVHWMDSKDLLEHGGSIAGSWLTAKGEGVLRIVDGGGL